MADDHNANVRPRQQPANVYRPPLQDPRLQRQGRPVAHGRQVELRDIDAPPDHERPHPLYIRAPPTFKTGSDIDLYLRRFQAYANATNCPENGRVDLLTSLLDDKSLSGVSRAINNDPNMTFRDMVRHLKRAEGYTANSEQYVTELRNRKRLRGESVWDYHLDLAKLAEKAYPMNADMCAGSLRESFIANINDSYIASRLRELQDFNMEELLDVAIMLYGCQKASSKQVHAVTDSNSAAEDEGLSSKLDTLADVVGTLAINAVNKCTYYDSCQYEDAPYIDQTPPVSDRDSDSDSEYQWQNAYAGQQQSWSCSSSPDQQEFYAPF